MARCIDADKVIDVMKAAYWDENMHSAKDDPCVIDAMIDWSIRQVKDAPTEDVAPVVHAHWVHRTAEWNFTEECSKCHFGHDYRTPFCPICGAKMDEKEGKE